MHDVKTIVANCTGRGTRRENETVRIQVSTQIEELTGVGHAYFGWIILAFFPKLVSIHDVPWAGGVEESKGSGHGNVLSGNAKEGSLNLTPHLRSRVPIDISSEFIEKAIALWTFLCVEIVKYSEDSKEYPRKYYRCCCGGMGSRIECTVEVAVSGLVPPVPG
jgi:hypothetical protein